jgi:hypothetical protein
VTSKLLEENLVQLTSDLLSSEIGEKKYIDYQQRPVLLEVLDSCFVLWGNLLGDSCVLDKCARTDKLNSKHKTCLSILSDTVCLELMRDIASSTVLLGPAVLDRQLWLIHNLFLHSVCLAKNEDLIINVLEVLAQLLSEKIELETCTVAMLGQVLRMIGQVLRISPIATVTVTLFNTLDKETT